jgi:uncharacterized protein (TIGR01777 family)
LADLCSKWEAASPVLKDKDIRIVHPRFGVVLSPDGGALFKMLPAYRFELGAKLGKGHQWMSWIDIDDLIGALYHILENPGIQGAVNLVSPHPIRQQDFATDLAKALHRKAWIRVPAFILKLLFGEMAEEMLLSSQKVYPKKLEASGYLFAYPRLQDLLHRYFAL